VVRREGGLPSPPSRVPRRLGKRRSLFSLPPECAGKGACQAPPCVPRRLGKRRSLLPLAPLCADVGNLSLGFSNTKRQVADQTLTGGNLALAKNWVEGIPVRVVRGHKLDSDFAPEEGYRYDGLYRIDDHWEERGQDGFLICRYRLEKLEEQPGLQDQGPSGVVTATATPQGNPSPGRTEVTTSRVIRCTQIGNEVKGLYGHACQVCGTRLETPVGPYAECCHIRPLGRPHNGPDTMKNVLCLCANCHVLFDKHAILISDDLTVVSTGEPIAVANGHEIDRHELEYHRSLANG
jgi:putative restriction endonuclease